MKIGMICGNSFSLKNLHDLVQMLIVSNICIHFHITFICNIFFIMITLITYRYFNWSWVVLMCALKNFFFFKFGCVGTLLHHTGLVARGLSCPEASGILLPWPGIEPGFPALERGFVTNGTSGEVPEKKHLRYGNTQNKFNIVWVKQPRMISHGKLN